MVRRLLPLGILLAAVVAVVLAAAGGGDDRHHFSVTVGEATNVVPGQSVKQGGVKVGEVVGIEPVHHGRDARLELALEDRAWPLPTGTRLRLHGGGTANFSNRYIAIERGHGTGTAVGDGGRFPTRDFRTPVEFDELLAAFPARSRTQLHRFLLEAGPALDASRPGLRRTLRDAPPLVDQAAGVLHGLDDDQAALRTLVRSADDVLGAVDDAQPGLRTLLTGAAGTFDAIADETTSLQAALAAAPGTLRTTRTTLARADGTLDRARDVAARLKPGVAELRRTAAPLSGLLREVRTAGPDARATLATARRAAPRLGGLLDELRGRSGQLRHSGTLAVDALHCIRPYTPDIIAFFTNWGDFLSGTDGKDHILRAQVQNLVPAPTNALPINTGQLSKLFPGLTYGFPLPPGSNAGQPWYLPECGAGPDALDPTKDPEMRDSSKVFDLPKLLPFVRVPKDQTP